VVSSVAVEVSVLLVGDEVGGANVLMEREISSDVPIPKSIAPPGVLAKKYVRITKAESTLVPV
jgi:hypothetical protein